MENIQTQPTGLGRIKRKKPFPKWLKLSIILTIIVALAVGIYFAYNNLSTKKTETKLNTTRVTYGDVSVTISGSGAIEPINEYELMALVQGEILADTFEEGSQVNKGDLLYKIDTQNIENSIEKAKTSVEKSHLSYQQALKNLEDLTVTSPINGVVTAIYVEPGDTISNGGKIMDIIDNSIMYLDIPFIASDATNISVGQSAKVTLDNSFYTMDGKVTRVARGTTVSSENVEISTVTIQIENPGAIKPGDKATAIINNIACNSSGTFSYGDERTLLAKQSGEVSYQPFKVGDKIKNGEKVLAIESENISTTLKNAELSLREAQLSLQNQQDQLKNYNITAPISGKVIQKNSKAGDTLDSSNTKTVMAIIADLSTIVFEISVDELDIAKISVGQKVDITADALEGKNFTGTVDNISVVGTTSNGVTSYPVKISIDNPDGLIPGMNVNANIVVESRSNVLRVPVSAVKRGNIVMVKIDESKQQGIDPSTLQRNRINNSSQGSKAASPTAQSPENSGNNSQRPQQNNSANSNNQSGQDNRKITIDQTNVPEGYKNIIVAVGLNDSSFIEITDGLNEGDIVVVPTTSSNNNNNNRFSHGGMGGSMPSGGGMSSGGMGGSMPSGGSSGNRAPAGGGTR